MRNTTLRWIAATATVLIGALLIATLWIAVLRPESAPQLGPPMGQGDYALTMTDGGTFTPETLEGAPSLVFFGFTHCPEVCPTTLGDIGAMQAALEEEGADPIRTFFVTVDPERDSADLLGEYVGWVEDVTGVTGSREEIDKAISSFRIYAAKVPLEDGDYTMDHSASILLFDADGRFVTPISYQEATDSAVAKIRGVQS